MAIELREHEVPELQEAIAVAAGGTIGLAAAHLFALIEIDLGAGAARAGRSGRPEIIVLAQTGDVIFRHAKRTPDVMGLIVIGENGEIQAIERKLEDLGDELEGPCASLLLGDAAEREIAEHLEEREVTTVLADNVDIVRAHALLARAGADLLHGLLALIILLELIHAGIGKQQRRIVRHEARGRIEPKPTLLKERKEG